MKLQYFHRLFCLLAVLAAAASLNAQSASAIVNFRVLTQPAGARFSVDGTIYTSAANFLWPVGSKHIVAFVADAVPSNTIVVAPGAPTLSPVQFSPNADRIYALSGWTDSSGDLTANGVTSQVVTADPSVTWLQANVTVNYRILLNFFDSPPATQPPVCDASLPPPNGIRAGLVLISGQCYWNNAIIYQPANSALVLNAFPYPGYVFLGWSNLGTNAFLSTYTLTGPITLTPLFSPAKRVRFETNPLGLQVLVDRSPAPTLTVEDPNQPCPQNQGLPAGVPGTFQTLCRGDFDFAPGSAHLVGAPTPQVDLNGKTWVFDSWGNGQTYALQGQNAVYTANDQTSASDKVMVNFVPGAQASFLTNPGGLKLTVDGRSSWPVYNFVWGLGTTHQVAAAPQQTDGKGRVYTFRGWDNGGGLAQIVTVDQNAVSSGLRMIASYDTMSRLVVQSSPAGQTLQVDGNPCQTPCNIDRPNGTTVEITAPTSVPLPNSARLDFASWSDGGPADHAYTISADTQTVTASYNMMYQLSASSDPANGATYQMTPASPDGFYPANTQVSVALSPNPGFKFRRWSGDLTGTYPTGALNMTSAHTVIAQMDRAPYIAPAGVQNAAGATPNTFVAPGSLIAIVGQSLCPDTMSGPSNPLTQTLDGVTVMVGYQLLPLVSVSPTQLIAQLPSGLSAGDYQLTVHSLGMPDVTTTFTAARNAPGLYSSTSNDIAFAVAYHGDGTPVTSTSPAAAGEQISVQGSGFGPYVSPVLDGFFPLAPAPALADTVNVFVGGQQVQADWAGALAGQVGMVNLLFTVPGNLPSGTNVDLQVQINNVLSNTVELPLQ